MTMDERLSWDKHIDSIFSNVGAMKRVKPFVPLSTTKMLYSAIIQPYFDYCAPYGIIAELGSKIGCKNTRIMLQE
jgi:hypothetical protein